MTTVRITKIAESGLVNGGKRTRFATSIAYVSAIEYWLTARIFIY